MRSGYLEPRPGISRQRLNFSDEALKKNATSGYFYGAGVYRNDACETSLVWGAGGRLFEANLNHQNTVREITPGAPVHSPNGFVVPAIGETVNFQLLEAGRYQPGQLLTFGNFTFRIEEVTLPPPQPIPPPPAPPPPPPEFPDLGTIKATNIDGTIGTEFPVKAVGRAINLNSPISKKNWFCQAERFLIIQDGVNRPTIYDGSAARRAGKNEVPTGGPMAYGQGRLWVAQGSSYLGGDLVNSDPIYGRDTVIRFTENTYLNSGGVFVVPGNCNPITALAFGSNIDTALGQASLLIFTKQAIYAFDAPVDREVWKDLNSPLQRFALLDYGSFSDKSVVTCNGDLFFRAQDGVRSFFFARRNFSERWDNTPISQEMHRAFHWDEESLLYASSATNFDRRFLVTIGPEPTDLGVVHRGLAVLNFDLVGALTKKLPPVWEGAWTGLRILQILKARVDEVERCFIFALADNDEIGIWELSVADHFDEGNQPINWLWETYSGSFRAPVVYKRLENAELWLDRFDGKVKFASLWTNDQHPCWAPWMDWEECAQTEFCQRGWPPEQCATLKNTKQQFRNRRALGKPPEYKDPINGGFRHSGYEFQLRMEITGYCRIKKMRMGAETEKDDPHGTLPQINGRLGRMDYSSQVSA